MTYYRIKKFSKDDSRRSLEGIYKGCIFKIEKDYDWDSPWYNGFLVAVKKNDYLRDLGLRGIYCHQVLLEKLPKQP